jgi:hypothetical protein
MIGSGKCGIYWKAFNESGSCRFSRLFNLLSLTHFKLKWHAQ